MNIHLIVSAFASLISLRTFAISSLVANVLIVASTDRSVRLLMYLNKASAVSTPNFSVNSLYSLAVSFASKYITNIRFRI